MSNVGHLEKKLFFQGVFVSAHFPNNLNFFCSATSGPAQFSLGHPKLRFPPFSGRSEILDFWEPPFAELENRGLPQ